MDNEQAEQADQGNGADTPLETYEALVALRAAARRRQYKGRTVEMTTEEMKEEVAWFAGDDISMAGEEKLDAIAELLGITLVSEGIREWRLRALAGKQGLLLKRFPVSARDPSIAGTYGFIRTMVWGLPDLAAAEAWLSDQAVTIRRRYHNFFDNAYRVELVNLDEAEARLRQRAAAEGLLLRASNNGAFDFDLLLDPGVCVDPAGRQWLLRNADLEEVHSWFEEWDQIRRDSAATEATLASLIPEDVRNNAEGINAVGEDDGRGTAPSVPWASVMPTFEEVPSDDGGGEGTA